MHVCICITEWKWRRTDERKSEGLSLKLKSESVRSEGCVRTVCE